MPCSGVRLQTDRLDVVAVRIDQERGVVVRAVVLAQSRRAVIAAAGLQPGTMEIIDRRPAVGGECQVHAARAGIRLLLPPQTPPAVGAVAAARRPATNRVA